MSIRPIRDKILVRPIPVQEVSKGGIIIPETVKDAPVQGEVIAVGEGILNRDAELVPLVVLAGDRILYKRNGQTITEIEQDGESYLIMAEFDVLAVIE
jgi:chaperonin GroES